VAPQDDNISCPSIIAGTGVFYFGGDSYVFVE